MAWISSNGYLNQSQMENNANIVISYLRGQGINDKTISALLGNMQAESTLNPNLNEVGGSGYGLVQWTPVSVLQNHCNALGLSPYTSGDIQLQVILAEIRGQSGTNEWYSTSAFVSNYYNSGATSDMIGITGAQFLSNSMNWEPEKLAILFMACYERPNYNPNVNHYTQRQANATSWYSYMGGTSSTYIPRLDDTGIQGNFHYYSQNPFYLAGYGMPNCTCYAWGRFWEIGDPNNDGSNRPTLPTGDAGTWFPSVVASGDYQTGQTPQLGAVACFSRNGGGAGHVAIVEEISSNGDITTSNSAWQSTFFYLSNLSASNGYNTSNYTFQGFIYNPFASQGGGGGGGGGGGTPTKKGFKFVLSQGKKRRNLLYG